MDDITLAKTKDLAMIMTRKVVEYDPIKALGCVTLAMTAVQQSKSLEITKDLLDLNDEVLDAAINTLCEAISASLQEIH